MTRFTTRPREDALRIWRAGVAAVDSAKLVRETIRAENDRLMVGDEIYALSHAARVVVVGAGKAGAGMAAGLEEALGGEFLKARQVTGWINVPADCVRPLQRIHLHSARPPHRNEPTLEGVVGSQRIIELVSNLNAEDVCICLLSGGGSALLPFPVPGVSLDDKLWITLFLSGAGANIQELNVVRKQLSLIKGGGLLRRCQAARMITLIISDVLGDPLDVIASGPTVEDTSTPGDALAILEKFHAREAGLSPRVITFLEKQQQRVHQTPVCTARNVIIGNNATAVDAAGVEAERLGYSFTMISSPHGEGSAEDVGRHLASLTLAMSAGGPSDCLISGGEPTVRLVPREQRGLGGRNQQLVLAATESLWSSAPREFAILSGGTDGEDGPTDAAGAIVDREILEQAIARGLNPTDYLARNDAYHFFAPLDALLKTGPTHTNVCDLRVAIVRR